MAISNPVDMSAITRHLGPVEGNKQVVELLLQDEGVDACGGSDSLGLAEHTGGEVDLPPGTLL